MESTAKDVQQDVQQDRKRCTAVYSKNVQKSPDVQKEPASTMYSSSKPAPCTSMYQMYQAKVYKNNQQLQNSTAKDVTRM